MANALSTTGRVGLSRFGTEVRSCLRLCEGPELPCFGLPTEVTRVRRSEYYREFALVLRKTLSHWLYQGTVLEPRIMASHSIQAFEERLESSRLHDWHS